MTLFFPDFDTLRLALTSGAVPPAVSLKPAVAGFDDARHVWLQPSASLPRAALAALQRLGVQFPRKNDAPLSVEVSCWPQVLPLERTPEGDAPGSPQAPVLFELTRPGQLAELVGEILRLGNDRQSFRWLERGGQTLGLLRVIGPPYYSLLRALDRDGHEAPRAYREQAPRVWVEVGHRHPLAEQIQPAKGQIVLLRPPRSWLYLEDERFTDIYEVLEFSLPGTPTGWRPAELDQKIRVPLRLARGGRAEGAELWVLRDNAVDQLDAFVSQADDHLLARLAFAVGEQGPARCVVVRARPSKQPPPVLVLQGEAFRPYLKLPNLFLPVGTHLDPPLRRDAVRRLLADDPDVVTWLYPRGDGRFTPESLPDAAFRPLSDWVDYVLDHDRQALTAWVQAAQFDFEPFVCKDDKDAAPPKPPKPAKKPRDKAEEAEAPAGPAVPINVIDKSRRPADSPDLPDVPELPRARPNELQERLHALEKRFLEHDGALDDPGRRGLWPGMALLNQALGHAGDAAVCWLNALWEEDRRAPGWARAWARAEALGEQANPADLDRLLADPKPTPGAVRALAALLTAAAHREEPPAALVRRLDRVHRFLERHEGLLPVRGAWLAWVALVKLSHGDVLALARARDRLLERLFQGGLSQDLDLPSFLRFSGLRGTTKYRAFRDWLRLLPGRVHDWIHRVNRNATDFMPEETEALGQLMLAFGLARLGEGREARELLGRAKEKLGDKDDVYSTLLEAFTFRVELALAGKPPTGPLPPEQLEYLEHMDLHPRYKVDSLRQHSRILEPHERIDPYRGWLKRYLTEIETRLGDLATVADRTRLAASLRQMLAATGKGQGQAAFPLVVRKALELGPRVGEELAREVLGQVGRALEIFDREATGVGEEDVRKKAQLLEVAMFTAAHFNLTEAVSSLLALFEELLQSPIGRRNLKPLSGLVGESFRGLRKLGMQDQISRLLHRLADVILEGRDLTSLGERPDRAAALGNLLHVAAGWYYFGKNDLARPVIDQARALLLRGDLNNREQTPLACTYAAALGQAPAELALPLIEELFAKVRRVSDAFYTNSHYSRSQLELIEAVVLGIASEDFAAGTQARRWLDDDEYLVRRRIHRDVAALV